MRKIGDETKGERAGRRERRGEGRPIRGWICIWSERRDKTEKKKRYMG